MNISPVTLKENRIHLKPAIFKLKSKLDLFINANCEAKSPEKENVKNNVLLRLVNSYIVDSPEPASISYLWNFGSLLGVCLVIQILTGVFLAMHYCPNIDLSFQSVEHISNAIISCIIYKIMCS